MGVYKRIILIDLNQSHWMDCRIKVLQLNVCFSSHETVVYLKRELTYLKAVCTKGVAQIS